MKDKLVHIIRKLVNEELGEAKQGRIGKTVKIVDKAKADRLKKFHNNTKWIVEMIDAIEKAGDKGISRLDIADELIEKISSFNNQRTDKIATFIRPKITSLIQLGVFSEGDYSTPLVSRPKPSEEPKPSEKPSTTSQTAQTSPPRGKYMSVSNINNLNLDDLL